jgi:hypothetical protein
MEKQFSEQESLELINQMINSAKNNLQKGAGKFFLLWGYLISGTALLNLLLLLLLPNPISHYAYFVWMITPLGLFPHFLIARKITQEQIVVTYVETIMNKVWIAFGISIGILLTSMLIASFQNWIHWSSLIPFMLILYGFALYISGHAYRFKPLITGAFICWISSTIIIFSMSLTNYFMELSLIELVICLIAGYIVPGHLLNKKEQSHV